MKKEETEEIFWDGVKKGIFIFLLVVLILSLITLKIIDNTKMFNKIENKYCSTTGLREYECKEIDISNSSNFGESIIVTRCRYLCYDGISVIE